MPPQEASLAEVFLKIPLPESWPKESGSMPAVAKSFIAEYSPGHAGVWIMP